MTPTATSYAATENDYLDQLQSAVPRSITEATGASTFLYDFDHSRVKQTHADGSTTIHLNPRLDSGETFEKITQGSPSPIDIPFMRDARR